MFAVDANCRILARSLTDSRPASCTSFYRKYCRSSRAWLPLRFIPKSSLSSDRTRFAVYGLGWPVDICGKPYILPVRRPPSASCAGRRPLLDRTLPPTLSVVSFFLRLRSRNKGSLLRKESILLARGRSWFCSWIPRPLLLRVLNVSFSLSCLKKSNIRTFFDKWRKFARRWGKGVALIHLHGIIEENNT